MRYGWRARIGQISPAILDTSGEEMRKLLPAGVLHVGLTISEPIQTLGAAQAAVAFGRMVDAGKRLAAEKVDVLICGGAPVLGPAIFSLVLAYGNFFAVADRRQPVLGHT